jgi:hypothetical protein
VPPGLEVSSWARSKLLELTAISAENGRGKKSKGPSSGSK